MVFVIAGIAIVIIAGLIVFFTAEDVQIGRRITTTQVEPVREYIGNCVEERMIYNLKLLKQYGAFRQLNYFPGNTFLSNVVVDTDFNELLPSSSEIEEGIENDIRDYLLNKCTLNDFKDDFEIIGPEDILVDVDIPEYIPIFRKFARNVVVNVDYPVLLRRGESELRIERLNVVLNDNFWEIYENVAIIVNAYANSENNNLITMSYLCTTLPQNLGCDNIEENLNGGWLKVRIGNAEIINNLGVVPDGELFDIVVRRK